MGTILIVEDNEMNRDMISRRLTKHGFQVSTAVDGEEGIRKARSELPQLILMDLGIPVIDGWEAMKRLRADPATSRIPIIVVSAHAMAEDREKALKSGADEYFAKPVEFKPLLERIEALTVHPVGEGLTAQQGQQVYPVSISRTAAGDFSGHRVLVVDDNPDNRDMLSRRFQKKGLQVDIAETGAEALDKISTTTYDVVLLDILMPGMDGIEVLEKIRRIRTMVQLPVIMVTAKEGTEDLVHALEIGANDYITKPIDFSVAFARTRTQLQLRIENEKYERLLLNILPREIAEQLKTRPDCIAEGHKEVSVLFADLVGFTKLSNHLDPPTLVRLLNVIVSGFDDLATSFGLEKIKTIGDGYMVVGGVPVERSDHAAAIANMALEMEKFMEVFNKTYQWKLCLKIGIHTGPVVAGVIGKSKFAYDLWGDTVNIASRMESLGETGKIQVSKAFYEKLKNAYSFEPRGMIGVKGIGEMETYFLTGKIKKQKQSPNVA